MSRIRVSGILIVLLGLLVTTSWALFVQFPKNANETTTAVTTSKPTPEQVKKSESFKKRSALEEKENDDLELKYPTRQSKLPLDVALIDPNGTSVIAGSAKPESRVVVSADGVEIGTVESDANGDWVLTTEHKFQTAAPKIDAVTLDSVKLESTTTFTQPKQTKQAKPIVPKTYISKPSKPPESFDVIDHLARDFERLVETARREKAERDSHLQLQQVENKQREISTNNQDHAALSDAKPANASTAPGIPSVAILATPNETTPTSRSAKEAPQDDNRNYRPKRQAVAVTPPTASIPIPIGFVYREATFTKQGLSAISLLAQYLAIKELSSVVLTGHADERGSERLNLDLSQARLDAVARELTKLGYSGELKLIAKGESEPYTQVDRTQLTQQELYALDRRVELKEAY